MCFEWEVVDGADAEFEILRVGRGEAFGAEPRYERAGADPFFSHSYRRVMDTIRGHYRHPIKQS